MIWDHIHMWILGIVNIFKIVIIIQQFIVPKFAVYAFSHSSRVLSINSPKSEIKRTQRETWKIILQHYVRTLLEMKGWRWFWAQRVFLGLSSMAWLLLNYHIHFYLWSLYRAEELVLSFTLSYTFATFFFTCFWQCFLPSRIKFEENLCPHHFSNQGHFK